jgi:hypothetical protein
MASQPGLDPLLLVGGGIVHHDMQLPVWVGLGEQLEEVEELAAAVARLAGVGHPAGGRLQRGEQGGRAMPDVVVGTPLDPARPDRSDGLGCVPAPDLGLLVHADHDRVDGRVQVEPQVRR